MTFSKQPLALRLARVTALAICLFVLVGHAEATCRSNHCGDQAAPPPACAATAQVRIPLVVMTGSFGSFRFEPEEPRIEPGSCVEWDSLTVTHSATADNCADLSNAQCDAADPEPACLWETGNVSSTDPAVLCHYATSLLPANVAEGFYCRPHSSPAHSGTMFGVMRVTAAIELSVSISPDGQDVDLNWTGGEGGGITPATRRFKVSRSTNDPAFEGVIETFAPAGGVSGTSFADVAEAANTSANRFYLVLHRQTTE